MPDSPPSRDMSPSQGTENGESHSEASTPKSGEGGARLQERRTSHQSSTAANETAIKRQITWNIKDEDDDGNNEQAEPFYLFVLMLEGRGLLAGDNTGESDPFVKLWIDNHIMNAQVTPTETQTRNPCWNSGAGVPFWFRLDDGASAVKNVSREAKNYPNFTSKAQNHKKLRLRVYDSDFGGLTSQLLGCANVDLEELEVGKVILRDVDLVGEDNGFPHAKVGEWARKQLSNKARKYGSVKMYLSLRARAEADAYQVLRSGNVVKQIAQTEYLYVTVIQARDLMPADANDRSDPYVVVKWKENVKKTAVKQETLKPYWGTDKIMSFPMPNRTTPHTSFASGKEYGADEDRGGILLTIMDEDSILKDDVLGFAYVNLPRDLQPGCIQTFWLDVQATPKRAGAQNDVAPTGLFSSMFSGSERKRMKYFDDNPTGLGQIQVRVGMGYVRVPRAKIDQRPSFRPRLGRMFLELISGNNIKKMDLITDSDAYVEVTYENIVESTSVRQRNKNPVWCESMEFDITEITNEIRILVKDDDSSFMFEEMLEKALGLKNNAINAIMKKKKHNEVFTDGDGKMMSELERAAIRAGVDEENENDDIIGKTSLPISHLWESQSSGERVEYELQLLGPDDEECLHRKKSRNRAQDVIWTFEPHRERRKVKANGTIRVAVTLWKEAEDFDSQKRRLETMKSDAFDTKLDEKGQRKDKDGLNRQMSFNRRDSELENHMENKLRSRSQSVEHTHEPRFLELYGGAPKLHDDVHVSRLRITPAGVMKTIGRFSDVILSPFRGYLIVCIRIQRFHNPLLSALLLLGVLSIRTIGVIWTNLRVLYPLILAMYMHLVSYCAVYHRENSGYERNRSILYDDDEVLNEQYLNKVKLIKDRRKREKLDLTHAKELAQEFFDAGLKYLPDTLKPEHDAKTVRSLHKKGTPRSKLFHNPASNDKYNGMREEIQNNFARQSHRPPSESSPGESQNVEEAYETSDDDEYQAGSTVHDDLKKSESGTYTKFPVIGGALKKYNKYKKAMNKIKKPYVFLNHISDHLERFASALMYHDKRISKYLLSRMYWIAFVMVMLLVMIREAFRYLAVLVPYLAVLLDERNIAFVLIALPTLPLYHVITKPCVLWYDNMALFSPLHRLNLTLIDPIESVDVLSKKRYPTFYVKVKKAFSKLREKYYDKKKSQHHEIGLKIQAMDAQEFQKQLVSKDKLTRANGERFSFTTLHKSFLAYMKLEWIALTRCFSRSPTRAEVLHRLLCKQIVVDRVSDDGDSKIE